MKLSWKPVAGNVPPGSILGLILFTTFIRWWCKVYPQPVCKWHKTESRGQRATLPSQGSLTGWRNRPTGTPGKLNKKCKVLQLEKNDPMHQDIRGDPTKKAAFRKWPERSVKRGESQTLSRCAHWHNQRQGSQTETQVTLLEHQETLLHY